MDRRRRRRPPAPPPTEVLPPAAARAPGRAPPPSPPPAPVPRDPMDLRVAVAVVALAVLLVHGAVLWARAVAMDDASFVAWNPIVCHPSLRSAARAFAEVTNPSTVRGYYIPLTMVSLMLDHALGARLDAPAVFHATSLALHVAAAGLVTVALHGLFRRARAAAFGALVFALHPMTVEAVAWIAERKTVLAGALACASLAAWVRAATGEPHRRAWLGASLAAYALAVLAKPTAMPLPAVLLALDAWPLRRLGARALVEKVPFALVAVGAAAVTWVSHGETAGIRASPSLGSRVLELAHNLGFYVETVAWPAVLTPVYPRPDVLSADDPTVQWRAFLALGLVAAAAAAWRRAPVVTVSAAAFALALAPTLGLVRFSWVAISDKYTYLALLGLALPATAALARAEALPATTRRRAFVAAAVLLAALALRTRSQLALWRDSPTLRRHLVANAPDQYQPKVLLANTLVEEGDVAEGYALLSTALTMAPGHPYVRLYHLRATERMGNADAAIRGYRELSASLGDFAEAKWFLGRALLARGDAEGAARALGEAVALKPRLGEARLELARAQVALGDRAGARRTLTSTLADFPDQPEATALLRTL